ncbi:MAG: carboxypeptidase-like regulatory domain-containing protein [Pirellulales bacterium]
MSGLLCAAATIQMPAAGQPNAKPKAEPADVAKDPDDPHLAGHYSGRVIGPDGQALPRARIFILRDHRTNKDIGPVRAETDADGRFEFDAPDMTYPEFDSLPARRQGLLIATADGLAPDWIET